jgi:hypothetical protein
MNIIEFIISIICYIMDFIDFCINAVKAILKGIGIILILPFYLMILPYLIRGAMSTMILFHPQRPKGIELDDRMAEEEIF